MMMLLKRILIIFICIYFRIEKCMSVCYFPSQLQGSYLTQSTIQDSQIQYSEINITEDSIPIWGLCHKRVGNNVILSSDEEGCYRCFNLKLVAKNILRVITTDPDFISKCYTNEEKALLSCPSDNILLNTSNYTKIIHYKFLGSDGNEIRYEYCPINGRYKFNYNNNDGKEDTFECVTKSSELDNCPSGSVMNLRFKECSFENHDLRFECLGHWTDDLDGKNYLALINNISPNYHHNHYSYNSNNNNNNNGGELTVPSKPQYRCGIFEKDPQTDIITVQFSKDSTCTIADRIKHNKKNNLSSNIDEYQYNYNNNNNNNDHHYQQQYHRSLFLNSNSETLLLYPITDNSMNMKNENYCSFPNWLQGEWQHITVKNDTFIYRDHISFKSYSMKCLEKNYDDTILVHSKTQCDEESYKCVKIKYRTKNVIEFQIGIKSSSHNDPRICSDEYFDDTKWLTQANQNPIYTPCPVNGLLEGMIPDAINLCAKLLSNCSSDDYMHYEVSTCDEEILEEREYRCLGQWTENDYVFTFTKRIDIGLYECFIGGIRNNEKIFIKEAGENCQRDIDPYKYSMELKQIETCSSSSSGFHNNKSPSISIVTESIENLKMPTFTAKIRTQHVIGMESMTTQSPGHYQLPIMTDVSRPTIKSPVIGDMISISRNQQHQNDRNINDQRMHLSTGRGSDSSNTHEGASAMSASSSSFFKISNMTSSNAINRRKNMTDSLSLSSSSSNDENKSITPTLKKSDTSIKSSSIIFFINISILWLSILSYFVFH